MKSAINVVMLAVLIVPFVVLDSANARTVTGKNGSTWSVNRSGGGNVDKTLTGPKGNVAYSMDRTCSGVSCTTVRTK